MFGSSAVRGLTDHGSGVQWFRLLSGWSLQRQSWKINTVCPCWCQNLTMLWEIHCDILLLLGPSALVTQLLLVEMVSFPKTVQVSPLHYCILLSIQRSPSLGIQTRIQKCSSVIHSLFSFILIKDIMLDLGAGDGNTPGMGCHFTTRHHAHTHPYNFFFHVVTPLHLWAWY